MLREFKAKSGALLEKDNLRLRKTKAEYDNSMNRLRRDIDALTAKRNRAVVSSFLQVSESPDVESWYQDLKKEVIPAGEIPPYSFFEASKKPLDIDALYAAERHRIEDGAASFLETGSRLRPLDIDALYAEQRRRIENGGVSFLETEAKIAPLDIDALYAAERRQVESHSSLLQNHDHSQTVDVEKIFLNSKRAISDFDNKIKSVNNKQFVGIKKTSTLSDADGLDDIEI
jgi:hypothetical protein